MSSTMAAADANKTQGFTHILRREMALGVALSVVRKYENGRLATAEEVKSLVESDTFWALSKGPKGIYWCTKDGKGASIAVLDNYFTKTRTNYNPDANEELCAMVVHSDKRKFEEDPLFNFPFSPYARC